MAILKIRYVKRLYYSAASLSSGIIKGYATLKKRKLRLHYFDVTLSDYTLTIQMQKIVLDSKARSIHSVSVDTIAVRRRIIRIHGSAVDRNTIFGYM